MLTSFCLSVREFNPSNALVYGFLSVSSFFQARNLRTSGCFIAAITFPQHTKRGQVLVAFITAFGEVIRLIVPVFPDIGEIAFICTAGVLTLIFDRNCDRMD